MNFNFPFLRKADQYLLKNHPWIWCIRLHQLLPWLIVGYVLVILLIFSQNPENYDNRDDQIIPWIYVASVAGMLIWLVYLLRFNPLKSFGKRPFADEYKNFILIFTAVVLLISLPMMYFTGRHARVHTKFKPEEIATAVNRINLGLALNRTITEDSVQLSKFWDSAQYERILSGLQNDDYNYYDSIYLDKDSILHCYDLDHFREIGPFYSHNGADAGEGGMPGLLSAKQIYYRLLNLKTPADSIRIISDMVAGINTFTDWDVHPDRIIAMTQGNFAFRKIPETYPGQWNEFYSDFNEKMAVTEQNMRFYNVYFWSDWEDIAHVLFYISFYITLLILIFRNMTIKTFLISVGAGVLLPVLFALILLATGSFDENDGFMLAMVLYLIGWGLFLFAGTFTRRTLLRGILLNWLTVTTPLLGIFIAAWWVEDYQEKVYWEDRDEMLIRQVLYIGEIAGMVFFMFLLQPVFKRWYVKWYSLPEE